MFVLVPEYNASSFCGSEVSYSFQLVFFFGHSEVSLSPLTTAATTGLLYQPQIMDDGDCGTAGAKRIGRVNLSARRKPALAPICPPQIPHDEIRDRTRAVAVGR
jgi:hypothetical protein